MATASPAVSDQGREGPPASVYTAGDLARRLKCSVRHVWRMSDAGKLPPAIRLGALVRWDASVIEKWIADGCPVPVRRRGA